MKTKIILGQKFGKWVVIDTTPIYTKGGQRNVKVQCECGTIEYKHWSSLRLGKTNQCMRCKRLSKRVSIAVGDKFKAYTVISEAVNINNQLKYEVECKCGHKQFMTATALQSNTRWFQCKKCASQKNVEKLTISNGKIGEVSLSILNRIKGKAILRKIDFELTPQYLWNLFISQNKQCAITGESLITIKNSSLDRIDSNIGYIEGNVQWVTKQANKCKHILSMSELYEFANKVISHANQQPSTPLKKCEGSETNS